jgi:hypothetical protein
VPNETIDNPELTLAEDIGDMSCDPVGFVEYAFRESPRPWQAGILKLIGEHLDSEEWNQPLRIAVASGHGIGKSALVSMIIEWAMSTVADTKVIVTANTGTQLATKTVPEIHKWFSRSINAHWWELKATSITIRDAEHSKLWRMDAIPWSAHNTEAFAGAHNEGKRIVVIFDEASAIEAPVWEVAEGALTDENTEIIWLAFGNPTQNSGRFRECFGKFKHRWHTFQIDSRDVEGTNKEQIAKWIADYGEDSDFVRVRVRGEFPRAGSSQFIDADSVAAARKYKAEGFQDLPKIIGVDVARFGDDQTVMFMRQGRYSQLLGAWRGKDVAEVTAQVIHFIEQYQPDGVVVDSDGIGAPVYDNLKFRGYSRRLFDFHGGHPAHDPNAYFNQRAEVWGRMRDWLQGGAQIPDNADIEMDLTGPEYGFSPRNQLQLEKKDDMKARGVSSPDFGDALAMTFAVTINKPRPAPKEPTRYGREFEHGWMAN